MISTNTKVVLQEPDGVDDPEIEATKRCAASAENGIATAKLIDTIIACRKCLAIIYT